MSSVYFNGNRRDEEYTFVRVAWKNWQEHEAYNNILNGSIEKATSSELKETGSFSFEGYSIPDSNDLIRVYYSFIDDHGNLFKEPVATLFSSYNELNYLDTTEGLKASGTLNCSSVLSALQDSKIGTILTIKKNSNAIYEASRIIQNMGLRVNAEPSSFALSADHTFEAGTDKLTIVNWLAETANFTSVFPDAMGTVQLKSFSTVQQRTDYYDFINNEESIIEPEITHKNNWKDTPNVVRYLYNMDDACIAAEAINVRGSSISLESLGQRERTFFEEISDLGQGGKGKQLELLAVQKLRELSCDIEYITHSHPYVPITIYDPVRVNYSGKVWEGNVDTITMELSAGTTCQTTIKKMTYLDIEIESDFEILRGE